MGEDLLALEDERRLEQLVDAAGGRDRIALGADSEEDRELVAPDSRDGVCRPDGGCESCADHREQAVARDVAEGVVDALEVVEVEEQHGHRSVDPVPPVEGVRRCACRSRARFGSPLTASWKAWWES